VDWMQGDKRQYSLEYEWTRDKGKAYGLPANGIYLCTLLCVLLMLDDEE